MSEAKSAVARLVQSVVEATVRKVLPGFLMKSVAALVVPIVVGLIC